MKFIFADSLDYVDPDYDFLRDETARNRQPYWDDQFPHEILGDAPYDGILVSRATVGDHIQTGKYTESQGMRFRRVGAREFLRFNGKKFQDHLLFADCGAFSYVKMEKPPYLVDDTIEFYEDGQFTHGCSIDHVIFDFFQEEPPKESISPSVYDRYEITLENASKFIKECKKQKVRFSPIGIVQGWSPKSMAEATKKLIAMGYQYIAIGGMVPLTSVSILKVLDAICPQIPPRGKIRLHILGFAKAGTLEPFLPYPIYSFDTTSPLLRAFKDKNQNYYVRNKSNELSFYTAIRLPQSTSSSIQRKLIKTGRHKLEDLVVKEKRALKAIRDFADGKCGVSGALERILEYNRITLWSDKKSVSANEAAISLTAERYLRTLTDKPWELCDCAICKAVGVETIIFRASNRNKRRGIHNLYVYNQYLRSLDLH